MSLESPITNTITMRTKPTAPALSITSNGIRFPLTFSASAQNTWPPSSGRNGNRLMIASDREISASTHSARDGDRANDSCVTV